MDREYLKREPGPVLAFRIGVDPIPDWAMTDPRIKWHSKKSAKMNDPFEHNNDTCGLIEWAPGGIMLVPYGYYIINEGGRLSACNEEMFDKLYREDISRCLDSYEDVIDYELKNNCGDIVKNSFLFNEIIHVLEDKIDRKMVILSKNNILINIRILKRDYLDWIEITFGDNCKFELRLEEEEVNSSALFTPNCPVTRQSDIYNKLLLCIWVQFYDKRG